MATPSSPTTRQGRRRCLSEQGQPSSMPQKLAPYTEVKAEEEETRDWAAGLPLDALLAVLGRLDAVDILLGAGHVCRPWRRATREEPELWIRVDLRGRAALSSPAFGLKAMAYAAASRGAGRCEAVWVEGIRDDSFVFFLSRAAPALKSLRLISCSVSTQALKGGIRKLPMLEELELSLYSGTATNQGRLYNLAETCTAAAEACPLLKRLRLSRYRFDWQSGTGDSEAMEIARMGGLRSLQLFGNSISNAGLAAILEGCVGLESLDIRHCFKRRDER